MNTATAETYDFIIIGSGAASVCAALVAQAAGKRALIVEKTNLFGGSTSMSGGVLWIPNSRQMHAAGVTDSYELARTYIDACVGDAGAASSPERRHAYLTEAPKAVEFVESHGMRLSYADGYSDYYEGRRPGGIARGRALEADLFDIRKLGSWADRLRPNYFGAPILVHEASDLSAAGRTWASKVAGMRLAWRLFRNRTGARLVGCGAAVQGRMLQIALQHKVPIWLDTRVKGFVRTGNRVTGLVVEREGAETELTARHGVLLNSGGFARNLEMRQRYQPQPASIDWTNANPGDTGEMIEAAMAQGAAIALTDQAWWTPISLMPDGTRALHPVDMSKPHSIMVDSSGRRYVNESGSYMEIGTAMYARHKSCPAVPSWLVLDSRHRKWYPWGAHLPGQTPEEWLTKGYMIRAESLDDLARQTQMDAATLRATVERFNGFARSGKDEDFGRGIGAYDRFYGDPSVKPNPNLGEISQPPFHAVRTYPGDVGTGGGLMTDEHARVLRDDRTPIEGLYATGNCTATIWGRCYPGPGVSIGGSMVFGYIAARHATA